MTHMPDSDFAKENSVETILNHASRAHGAVKAIDGFTGKPVMLVPKGWFLQSPEWTEKYPPRVKSTVTLYDMESFARYVSSFRNGDSAVFAKTEGGARFEAVIDYHADRGDVPSWCSHRVVYEPKLSNRFSVWYAKNKTPMTQLEFSAFIEDNLADVVSPAGADLLEIVNKFEVDGALSFSKAIRMQDGSVKFAFTNETKARSGEVEVPARLGLVMPLYDDTPVVMSARLRYRLSNSGDLKLWYELEKLAEITKTAIQGLVASAEKLTGIKPFIGAAPSQA